LNDQQKVDSQRESNEINREKNTNDKLLRTRELDLQEKKIGAENRRTRGMVRAAKVKKKDK